MNMADVNLPVADSEEQKRHKLWLNLFLGLAIGFLLLFALRVLLLGAFFDGVKQWTQGQTVDAGSKQWTQGQVFHYHILFAIFSA